jgi:hypothetical protein
MVGVHFKPGCPSRVGTFSQPRVNPAGPLRSWILALQFRELSAFRGPRSLFYRLKSNGDQVTITLHFEKISGGCC